ncbi:MAG: hypothetical protein HZB26_04625 [Candidatus Hydrogenedentes bacterium]|nr:hypothetical protein [Candidatus Hydrogenedentota bacterium]
MDERGIESFSQVGILLLAIGLFLLPGRAIAAPRPETALSQMPAGYRLQAYDDCGVQGRQPHAPSDRKAVFAKEQVEGDERQRSVTFGVPHFDMVYENLNSAVPCALAITYASERGNRRVQSLFAGKVLLHGPRVLPDGKTERLLFSVPPDAIENGRLILHFECNEGPNAVVSIVELWAPLPAQKALHLSLVPHPDGRLEGHISNIAFDGIGPAEIALRVSTGAWESRTATTKDGTFAVNLSERVKPGEEGTVDVTATFEGASANASAALTDLYFIPPNFVPIPLKTPGLARATISMDGVWRINPKPGAAFATEPTDGAAWSDFHVPGQFLQQGFDVPREKPVTLATDFVAPASWRDRRVFLRFDAVHGGVDYWLNGKRLGYSENLFTPVEFDITDSVRVGESNHLALSVNVETASELASFSSNYAFHSLGGVDRSVHVFALPSVHIAELRHEVTLDAQYKDAILTVDLLVANKRNQKTEPLSVELSLIGADGRVVPLDGTRRKLACIERGEQHLDFEIPVPSPLLWNAERPNLYTLRAELRSAGKLLERVERSIGFRVIETRNGQLLINGKSVKLAGINRHEIDPLTGRAATAKHGEEDARLLKEANYNFVRTSHYPPTQEFLDACDRLGLYVECEAPFCWTRTGRGEDDPALTKSFLTPTAAMLAYHRAHPSIIVWSLANESGQGPDGENALPSNFAATRAFCKHQDPSRPLLFNNEWAREGGACDIAVLHYPPFPPEQYKYVKDDPRPILIDEYFPPQTFTFADELYLNPGLDVVNWSTGQNSPTSYWNQIYQSKNIVGGSIWAGIDEEFIFKDGKTLGYGPWGFLDVWRRKKSLWWDTKLIHSPIWIPIRRIEVPADQSAVSIPVENRYSFTNLSELKTTWELGNRRGACRLDIPPQTAGAIAVPVSKNLAPGSLLVLRFFDTKGTLVTAHGITFGAPTLVTPPKPSAGCPNWHDNGKTIVVRGKEFDFELDKSTGALSQSSPGLKRFPTLFATRREDKNAFNPNGLPYAQYPDAATRVIDAVTAEACAEGLCIILRDHYKDFSGAVKMVLDNDGQLSSSFDYTYSGQAFNVSELGLRFLVDERYHEIRWRRLTEWDVYPTDHIGRPQGTALAYHTKTSAPFPPYHEPPKHAWYLDANEYGTRDFRCTKYNILEAQLLAHDRTGIRVDSDGSANVRACLAPDGVQFHLLLSAPPAQLTPGCKFSGNFSARLCGRS